MKNFIYFLAIVLFSFGNSLNAQSLLVVAEGTTTNAFLPVYGYWMDANQHNHFIYPATEVAPLTGATISKMTFHAASASSSWGGATGVVSIAATTQGNFTSATYATETFTQVYSGTVAVNNNIWEVTFTTPFTFNGGNMIVNIVTTTAGSFSDVDFYGITTTGGGILQYGSYSASIQNFVPKTTFEYTGGSPVVLTSPVSSINATSAILNGSYYNMTSTSYGFQYMLTTSTDWSTASTVTASSNPMSVVVSSLTPNTQYKYRAFANNGTTFYYGEEKTFTTLAIPANLPYACDFENPTENAKWTLINGTQTNKFYIGDASQNPAINNTLGGSNALYISNDGGPTWAYSGTGSTTDSWVYAYRDFEVPVGVSELKLDFDWIANGSGSGDFLRVYWVPTNIPVVAGSIPPTISNVNYDLTTMIGNYTNGYGQHWLSRHTTWQHATFTINTTQFPTLAGSTWRLYVHWRNNQSTAIQPPATVDNMTLVVSNCPTPRIDLINNITQNTADINFFEFGSATIWNFQYRVLGTSTWADAQVNLNPYTLSGLQPSTSYEVRMQSDCSSEQSAWSPIKKFNTACGTITQIPWTDYFDNYSTGSTIFPACWTKKSNITNMPNISTTNFSAPASMHFYCGSSGNYANASTPMIDAAYPINTLMLNFMYRVSGNDDTLYVGTMTNPLDSTTFTEIAKFNTTSTATWINQVLYLNNYQGTDQYITFRTKYGASSSTIYIDNLQILAMPTCLIPNTISSNNITAFEATINWLPGDLLQTTWWIYYKPVASVSWDSVQVFAYPHILTNLLPSTNYQYYMRTDCGSEFSAATNLRTFMTQCIPFSTLPWNDGFESITAAATLPPCWASTSFGNRTNTQIENYGDYNRNARTGSRAAYFVFSCDDRFFTPGFDLIAGVAYQFTYWYVTDGLGGWTTLQSGVYSAQNGNSLVQTMNTISLPTNTTYQEVVSYFTPTSDGIYFFGIYCQANSAPYYLTLDDFSVDLAPDCIPVQQLAVTNIVGTSAYVNWVPAGTPDSYTVELSETGSGIWNSFSTTDPNFILTNLTELTDYSVQVYPICSGDEGPRDTVDFTTICAAGGDLIIGTPNANTNSIGHYLPTDLCYEYSYSQQIFDATEITTDTISNIAFQYFYSTSDTRKLKIYLGHTTQSSFTDFTDYIPFDSLTQVFQGNVTFNNSGLQNWVNINFDTPFAFDGIRNLVIVIRDTTGTSTVCAEAFRTHSTTGNKALCFYQNTNAINPFSPLEGNYSFSSTRNNIKISLPCETVTCYAPNVILTDITSSSATMLIVPGATETSWEGEYKAASDTAWTSLGTVTSSPFTLPALLSNTYYQVRFRSVCGATDMSTWKMVSFTTDCGTIITLPFTENFDSYASGSSSYPTCWNRISTAGSYPYVNSNNALSAPNSLYFYSGTTSYSMIVLPPVDLTIPLNTLQLTFWGRNNSAGQNLKIGVMTDPYDASTFSLIGTFTPVNASTFEEYVVSFANYTDTGAYIAIKSDNMAQSLSNEFYIDNLSLDLIPSCSKPLDIVFSAITTTSATASWDASPTALSYEVVYGLPGVDPATATPISVSDTFYVMTPLTATTLYHLYVRSVCAGGEYSEWTSLRTFSTVALAPVPYTEGFTSSSVPVGYNLTSFDVGSDTYVPGNPPNNLMVNLYSSNPTANFKTINIGPLQSNYELAFEYAYVLWSGGGLVPAGSGNFIVAISTNWGDTYTNVDTVINNGLAGYQSYSLDLSAYDTQIIKIKITGNWNSSDYYLAIDNIYVGPIITCPFPTLLTAGASTQTSAELSWTENGTVTEWQIEYGPTGFIQGTGVYDTTNSNPCTISSLNSGTSYDFYVRSVCGIGVSSAWSEKVTVTTSCSSFSPPLIEGFELLPTIPTCWSTYSVGANFVSSSMPPYTPHSGSRMLCYYHYNSDWGNYAVLFSPEIAFTGEPVEISYWQYRDPSFTSPSPEGIEVLYNSIASLTGAISLGFSADYYSTAGWYKITYSIPAGIIGNCFILFKANSPIGRNQFIDDISIHCAPPSNLTLEGVSSTSISATWDTSSVTSSDYIISYSTNNTSFPFNTENGIQINIPSGTSLPYVISGFNPGDSIWLSVSSVTCGSWANTQKISLPSVVSTVPYFCKFEDSAQNLTWTLHNGSQINKWYIGAPGANGGIGNGLYVSSNNGNTASYNISASSIVMASTTIQFNNALAFTLSFDWCAKGENYVDHITAYLIPITFDIVPGTIIPEEYKISLSLFGSTTWQTQNIILGAQYSNTIKRLVFVWTNNFAAGIYPPGLIDNVVINPICVAPTNLVSSNIGTTSVDLSWINHPSQTEFLIEYKLDSDTIWNRINSNLSNYHFTQLLPSSTYDARIKTVCAVGDTSIASNSITFTTLCVPMIPPTTNEPFSTMLPNICWERKSGDMPNSGNVVFDPSTDGWISRTSLPSNTASASFQVSNHFWLITPSIDLGDGSMQYQIDFDIARTEYGSANIGDLNLSPNARFIVLISPDNGTTWNSSAILKEWNNSTGTHFSTLTNILQPQSIPLYDSVAMAPYTGLVKIAFYTYEDDYTYNYNEIHIDNFQVNAYNPCARPNGINTIAITPTSAQISWNENGTATAWILEYGTPGFTLGTGTMVNVSSNPFVINNLDHNNTYQYYIKADCGDGTISYWSLPDTFTTLPCPFPTELNISNITLTSMDLAWTENGTATEWEIEYGPTGFLHGSGTTIFVSTNPYTITQLSNSTAYDFYVKSACGEGDSSVWSVKVSDVTPCVSLSPPVYMGFEALSTIPTCWTTYSFSTNTIFSIVNSGLNPSCLPHNGNRMLEFIIPWSDGYAVLYSPLITLTGAPVEVSYWQYRDPSLSGNAGIEVLFNSTPSITGATSLGYTSGYFTTAGWYQITYTIPAGHIGNFYIMFIATYQNNLRQYIDDISIQCSLPSNLIVESVSTTSFSVKWDNSTIASSDYIISYKVTPTTLPFNPENGTQINIPAGTPLPYVINGLNPNDSIWVSVRAVCGSNWADAQNIPLPNVVSAVPYLCNFEDTNQNLTWTLHNGTQTNKWYMGAPGANGGFGNGLYVSSDNGNTASYNNSATSIVMASTVIQFNNALEFALSFDWLAFGENNYDYIVAYLIPLTYNIEPGTIIPNVYRISPNLSGSSSWQTKNIVLGAQYSNTVKRLVFEWRNDYIYGTNPPGLIDKVFINPVCVPPTNVTASNIGISTADLSWSNFPFGTEFLIEYKLDSDTIWNRINSNTSTYQLTQLVPSSNYNARIISVCAPGDTSIASNIITFTTLCAPMLPPTTNEPFSTMLPSICWEMKYGFIPNTGNAALTPTNYGWQLRTSLTSSTASGYFSQDNRYWLITPSIDLGDGSMQYQIDFDIARTASGSSNIGNLDLSPSASFVVLISTDNGSTWNSSGILKKWNNSTGIHFSTLTNSLHSQSIRLYDSVAMAPYTGLVKIAFSTYDPNYNLNEIHIDNFQVNPYNPCSRPDGVNTLAITPTSSQISWTENGTATTWIVEYGAPGFTLGTGTILNATSNPFVIYNLAHNTTYQYYVKADCGDGTISYWSLPDTFTTLPCPFPTELNISNITLTSMDLAWTENGTASEWEIEYGPTGFLQGSGTTIFVNTNPYNITQLSHSTTYDFYVKAVCGVEDSSVWSVKVSAATLCVSFSPPVYMGFEAQSTIPTCWSTFSTSTNFSIVNVGSAPTCTPHSENRMLCFNSYSISAGNYAVLFSPIIALTGAPIEVSFWQYRDPSYSNNSTEGIEILYNSTNSLTGATSLGFTSRYFANAGWYNIKYIIPEGIIGNYYIMFKATSQSGNNQYFDDISILCLNPSTISLENVSTTSISLNWNNSNSAGSDYILSYEVNALTPFNPENGTQITIPTGTPLPYIINGFTFGDKISVAVKSNCSTTWTTSEITLCPNITPPSIPETFETMLPNSCWDTKTGNLPLTGNVYLNIPIDYSWYIQSNLSTNSASCALFGVFNSNWLITPSFDLGDGTIQYELNFDLARTEYNSSSLGNLNLSYNARFVVLISTDNGATWNSTGILKEWNNSTGTPFSSLTNFLQPQSIILYDSTAISPYTGIVKFAFFVFEYDNSNTFYNEIHLDNFQINVYNPCMPPNEISNTTISSTSAQLNWTENNGASSWVIEYGAPGFTLGTGTIVNAITNPFTLIGLEPSTTYEYYIKTNCIGSSSSNWSLPNNFTTLPSCPIPSALIASNITVNSANLSWTENGFATAWEIEYGPTGFIQGTGLVIPVTNNPYLLTSLTNSTTYDFYVKAVCGVEDSSLWSVKISFTTPCLPISLPLIEGFESSSSIPTCWTTSTTDANYSICSSGTHPTCSPHGGTKMLLYNSYSIPSGNHAILYSPIITLNGAPVMVSYWQYRDTEYNGIDYATEGVEVLFNSSPSTIGATSLGFTSRYNTTAGWFQISYTIPAGMTGNIYIIFKTTSEYGNNQYIDDININYLPVICSVPNGLAVSFIQANNATITWTSVGTETAWELAYKESTSSIWNAVIVSNTPSFNLVSLTSSTNYDVKVRAICSANDTSAYSSIINFTTLFGCITPTSLSISGITTTYAIITWSPISSETSWEVDYKPASSSIWITHIANTYPIYYLNGLTSSTNYNVRVRSVCSGGIYSDYTVIENFATATPPCNPPSNLQITNITHNSAVVSWTMNNTETSWELSYKESTSSIWNAVIVSNTPSFNLVSLTSSTSYDFKVRAICAAGDTSIFSMISNFTTLEPPCYTPTNLAVTAISTSSATITWNSMGTETQWQVDYKPALSSVWNTQIVNTYPIYYFSGLTPSTNYNVRVRSVCSGGIYSDYTVIENFLTSAPPCLVPTNLQITNITNNSAVTTWTTNGTETSWQLAYKESSSSIWNTVTVSNTPSFNLVSLTSSTIYDVKVRAICSANDTSIFTTISNFTTLEPPCNSPTDLLSSNITPTSATISWTAGGTETQWLVDYKLLSSTIWTSLSLSSTTTQLIQSLQANSTYEVRVKAICSLTNESAFSTPIQFTTEENITYIISATANSFGTISPSGSVVVNAGADQLFTFIPNLDCTIDSLVINDGNPIHYTLLTYTFPDVTSNQSITAIFSDHSRINENQIATYVHLFPNPTNSFIEISIDNDQLQVYECRIFDIYGKLLKINSILSASTLIDVSDLTDGIYIASIISKKGIILKKFVKL